MINHVVRVRKRSKKQRDKKVHQLANYLSEPHQNTSNLRCFMHKCLIPYTPVVVFLFLTLCSLSLAQEDVLKAIKNDPDEDDDDDENMNAMDGASGSSESLPSPPNGKTCSDLAASPKPTVSDVSSVGCASPPAPDTSGKDGMGEPVEQPPGEPSPAAEKPMILVTVSDDEGLAPEDSQHVKPVQQPDPRWPSWFDPMVCDSQPDLPQSFPEEPAFEEEPKVEDKPIGREAKVEERPKIEEKQIAPIGLVIYFQLANPSFQVFTIVKFQYFALLCSFIKSGLDKSYFTCRSGSSPCRFEAKASHEGCQDSAGLAANNSTATG